MKIFSFLMICANSVIIVLAGFPATANPSKEFFQPLIAQDRSPADVQRQREAEEKVKDAERERTRDRERIRDREIIIIPGSPGYQPSPNYPNPDRNYSNPNPNSSSSDRQQPNSKSSGTFSLSTGFKDGAINPAIGYRLPNSNIGFEIGAVFDRDALPPGSLTDDPGGSLIRNTANSFNNLGIKKTAPNIGGDVLGFIEVSPQVAVYGGVGIYFQGKSQIIQSNVTNDLFKETNETNVSLALSGGADFKLSDAWRIGAGYHSLRGVTAKIGYEF